MSTATKIIATAMEVEGVLDVRLDVDEKGGVVYLTVTYDPMKVVLRTGTGGMSPFTREVEQEVRAVMPAGVDLSISWEAAEIGIDWADREEQELRERIRQKILEKYPTAGDGIKVRGLGGPW